MKLKNKIGYTLSTGAGAFAGLQFPQFVSQYIHSVREAGIKSQEVARESLNFFDRIGNIDIEKLSPYFQEIYKNGLNIEQLSTNIKNSSGLEQAVETLKSFFVVPDVAHRTLQDLTLGIPFNENTINYGIAGAALGMGLYATGHMISKYNNKNSKNEK